MSQSSQPPANRMMFLCFRSPCTAARRGSGRSYGPRSPLKYIRARGRIIFLFFPRPARALKIWQINSAILKVPDGAWNS